MVVTIVQEAAAVGIPLLDLRTICTEPGDYAIPIEPASQGGNKIAAGIRHLFSTHAFEEQTALYP